MKLKLSNEGDTRLLQLLMIVFIVLQVICMGGIGYCVHLINKRAENTSIEKPSVETQMAKQMGKRK